MRNRDFDKIIFPLTNHLAMSDILFEVLFDLPFDDIFKTIMVLNNTHYLDFTSPLAKILAT